VTRRLLFVIFAVLVLAACSGDDSGNNIPGPGPGPDPDRRFDIDIVRFRVWTLEAGGAEKLRWIGTWEGPLEESPEQTRWPWIGYGRAFRVDWKAFSRDLPIRDHEYRVSQLEFGPWIEVDGAAAGFDFSNFLDADQLVGESCPEGLDCVGQLRFDSGRQQIQVQATTTSGRILDEELGILQVEVNYPPLIELIVDPATGPEDPDASPVVSWVQSDGSVHRAALAEGDSIPSGATVSFRVRGWDRFASTAETDSFCCDEQLDSSSTTLKYHGMTDFAREDPDGARDTLFTLFGANSEDPALSMDVGPFDYTAAFRAIDEHGRRGESARFSFVAGFPPEPPAVNIPDGGSGLLNPERDPLPGEIQFVRTGPVNLAWDPELNDWIDADLPLRLSGYWYEIPLSFRGKAHPRARNVATAPSPDASEFSREYSDHVRSFAYELINERDPFNGNSDGPGDRDDFFLSVDAIGELDLTGTDAWRIFVPDLVFLSPGLFDPEGDCVGGDAYCAMGTRLLEQLGMFEMRFRSHTTKPGSVFHQESPEAGRDVILDLQRHGRFSEWVTLQCSVRLAFIDEAGQVTGLWPPDTP
jgi:hypothetical protein